MPRPAIELSRRYGKPAHGERGYSSTWRRGRAGADRHRPFANNHPQPAKASSLELSERTPAALGRLVSSAALACHSNFLLSFKNIKTAALLAIDPIFGSQIP